MTIDDIIQKIFSGRMSRRNFVLGQSFLLLIIIFFIIFLLDANLSKQNIIDNIQNLKITLLIIAPLIMSFQFMCSFRRLHDINQNGLWAFLIFSSLMLIPFLDIIFLGYISAKKGDAHPNKYGDVDTRTLFNSLINTQ